jgi:hypothetical protein
VRYAPKEFKQRRPDGHGGWIWNLKGLRYVIFQLPAVRDAITSGHTICAAEGEEDVKVLAQHGYTATCNHGGAEKWTDRHSQFLAGAVDVVLFGDHDEAGRRHLSKQIKSLKTVGIVPRIAQLDGLDEHGDVRAWMKTHTTEDLERVIKDAMPATEKPLATKRPDVQDPEEFTEGRVIRSANGKPISCQHNALMWLAYRGYNTRVALDTFTQLITVDGQALSDELVVEMVRQMEETTLFAWTDSHVRNALVSLGSRHPHSSLTIWLDSLIWDQKERLDMFFHKTYGADYSDYTKACAYVMFISAVARAYRPGCKADVTVVLIGDQGIGKSKGIADLVPDLSWYPDDLGGDLYDRKVGEGLQGKWLIEFGEFARINRATLDVVKAFLSRQVDHYRPAYGRITKDFPRQCIFVGTTNNRYPLQDLENRRFMPVHCPRDMADISSDHDQLWAEAVHLYKAGVPWWVSDKQLVTTVKEHQENARQHDEWEEVLRAGLKPFKTVTLSDAANFVHISEDRLDKGTTTRLGLVMKTLGYVRKRATTGDRTYYYEREEKR